MLLHERLSKIIVPTFYDVYRELRDGFLESNYRNAMAIALEDEGLLVEQEKWVDVHFRGRVINRFRLDLVVEGLVVLECKAAQSIAREHRAQLLNYLHATRLPLGYVLNFGAAPSHKRLVYDRKNPHNSV